MGKNKNKVIYLVLIISILILTSFFFLFVKTKKEVKAESDTRFTYKALQITNDPLYSTQWNIPKTSTDRGWGISKGNTSTVIAVLDTGFDLNHEDLVNKWDRDSNNSIIGYDFVGNDSDPSLDSPVYYYNQTRGEWLYNPGAAWFHGTVVAGIAAASTNNSKGVAGTCWNCKIMPIRVLDNDGTGTSDKIALGIRFAADNGANVINMSFGYAHALGSDSGLASAIDYAYSKGVTMVAAAGNDGGGVNYPAAYSKVIAVGAVDQNDQKTSWSSYGPELDIMAPGVSVESTYNKVNEYTGVFSNTSYATASGTSISAPIVSGAVALLLSSQPSLSNDAILTRLETFADKTSSMNGNQFTQFYGYGRLNTYQALAGNFLLTSSLALSSYNAAIGESVTDSFTLRNYLPTTATLDRLLITGRDPSGNPVDYPIHYNVTLAAYGDSGGADSITISDSRSFVTTGVHAVWVSYLYQGQWYCVTPIVGQTNYMTFNVHKPNLSVTGFYFTPGTPTIGQDVTATYSVKNNEPKDVTVDVLSIGNRLTTQWYPAQDYGGYTGISIPAGQAVTYSVHRTFDNPGLYVATVSAKTGNIWSDLNWGNGVSSRSYYWIKIPKLTITAFYFTPTNTPLHKQITATYTVKNNEQYDVQADVLSIGNRLTSQWWPAKDYGGYTNTLIPAGGSVTYSVSQVLDTPGLYVAWVSSRVGSIWSDLNWGNGVSSRSYYWVK